MGCVFQSISSWAALRALQCLALEGLLDHQLEVTGCQGLGQKVPGAFLHRLHRLLHRRVGRHDDHRGLWRCLPGVAEHVEAAHPREPQIQEHDGRSLGGELLDRRAPLVTVVTAYPS